MTGSLHSEQRPAAADAAGGLVFFHGRAGHERDSLPLLDQLDPARRLHAFAPRGPLPWGGEDRAAWDDPRRPAAERDAAVDIIARWIDELPFPPERLVLGGWSQGGALAYSLGLGTGRRRAAAVLAFGAFMPDQPWFRPHRRWPLDLARPLPPIAIVHGTNDDVVSVEEARRARALFADAPQLHYREMNAGHWVDPEATTEAGRFLARALPALVPRPTTPGDL